MYGFTSYAVFNGDLGRLRHRRQRRYEIYCKKPIL